MADDDYVTRRIPLHVADEDTRQQPFVVAFERGGGYRAGDRLSLDAFRQVVEDYDAVIVHRKQGDHPSQPDRFLLYNAAQQALDADDNIRSRAARDASVEVTGRFRWFSHGKDLAVDTTIGLHCLREDIWAELP